MNMNFKQTIEVQIELQAIVNSSESLRAAAKKMKISPSHLSRVIMAKVRPGPKVLDYLGLEEVRVYIDNKDSK